MHEVSYDCVPEVAALLNATRSSKTAARWPMVDARTLVHVADVLQTWYEEECGTDSGCIVRGYLEADRFVENDGGWPYWQNNRGKICYRMADREKAALWRLQETLENYPSLSYYLQTDPRGAPLYLYRKSDLEPDAQIDAVYSEIGVAVYA